MENYGPQFKHELRPVSVQSEAKKWVLVSDCKTKKIFFNKKNEQ